MIGWYVCSMLHVTSEEHHCLPNKKDVEAASLPTTLRARRRLPKGQRGAEYRDEVELGTHY